MAIKAGDVLIHKATGQRMVVIGVISEALIMCRYRNEISAKYEAREFFKSEFTSQEEERK